MYAIDEILALLEDGHWHSFDEIAEKSGLRSMKLEVLLDFLTEYEFINFDPERREIKLTNLILRLFGKWSIAERVNNQLDYSDVNLHSA